MEGRSAPTKGFCKSRFTNHFFLRRFDLPPRDSLSTPIVRIVFQPIAMLVWTKLISTWRLVTHLAFIHSAL
jgi:hypothetical protein